MTSFRAGVDIGGTFTDVVFAGSDGRVLVKKVASTPDDYGRAVLEGLALGIEELGISPSDVSEVGHGFTVATNAILEGKGEPTALITTEGFRDVLELARIRTPHLYDLYYQKPPPLVQRDLRFEVSERMTFEGEVLKPLDPDSLAAAVERVAATGVRSVAISLLHSYANPDHERRVAEAVRARLPDISLSVSSVLLPEMREYERTSTTVINAYVRPVVARYLGDLKDGMLASGIEVPLMVMQSNGGLSPVESAIEKPMYCIESGPAAGVVGAYHLGKRLGIDDMITFDMGGTTAKASMIEGGEMLLAPEYEVGGGNERRPPTAEGLRIHPPSALDRPRGSQLGRRQHRLGRQGRRAPVRAAELRRRARAGLLRPRRRRSHRYRRQRRPRLPQPGTPARRHLPDRGRQGPSGAARQGRAAAGSLRHRRRQRRSPAGQLQHGPRAACRVERAGKRPPALHPGGLRRRRPAARRRPRGGARHPAHRGPAVPGGVQRVRFAVRRSRAPLPCRPTSGRSPSSTSTR